MRVGLYVGGGWWVGGADMGVETVCGVLFAVPFSLMLFFYTSKEN